MTSLKGDLRSIMGTPFGGVGHAVLIFSRVTRAAFNSDSVVLQLHDRIEMPEEADGKFQVDGLDPGPIRIELEGGTVHNHGWNIDLPDEGVWSLTDLVDAQVDWSPAVIGRAEAAAREARDHADRAEAGADRVGTAEQVGVWASEASSSASAAASARSAAQTARNAAQSARDAAEGHANRAATSESNAKTSETNAKQSETNAGDYAAVATTAATEAVDAMDSVSDIIGAKYATQEYVDSKTAAAIEAGEIAPLAAERAVGAASEARSDRLEIESHRAVIDSAKDTVLGYVYSQVEPTDAALYGAITTPGTATNGWVEENLLPKKTTAPQEASTIGAELITGAGWTLGAGWAGSLAAGFTHTPGSTEPLVWAPASSLGAGTYLVEWMWDGTTTVQDKYSGYDVTLGDGEAGIIYQGAAPNNVNYSRAIKMTTAGNLVFAPWTMFEGRIHSISIRKVVSAAQIGAGFKDSTGYRTAEFRFGKSAQYNIFFGTDSGKWNFSGNRNVAIGDMAMRDNVTGFFNAAIGYEALRDNVSGTRNMAIGYRALAENISGDRNVGIGPFALTRNTTGQRNVAIGVDVLWRSTTGDDNVGIGYLTQTELRSGESNIAIGRYAMRHTHGATDGSTAHNIAVGREALGRVTGVGNIGIGRRSLASTVGREGNVAIGDYALEVSDTVQQTAVGKESLRYFTGGRNTAFGNNALKGVSGASTGSRNVAVGDNAAIGLTSGSNNTVIGPSAGPDLATARNNILIGFSTYTQGNRDDFLNIGNVLYGDLAGKKFGIGLHTPTARLHLLGGSSSEGTAPLKFSDGTLTSTPEVGALEFAGGKLYFTPTTGTRREIAFVAAE